MYYISFTIRYTAPTGLTKICITNPLSQTTKAMDCIDMGYLYGVVRRPKMNFKFIMLHEK